MDERAYCRQVAAPAGSTFATLLRYQAPERQDAFCIAQALFIALTDLAQLPSERLLARQKLAWWQEQLQRAQEQKAGHPILLAWQANPQLAALPFSAPLQWLEASESLLDHGIFPDAKSLELYAYQSYGQRSWLLQQLVQSNASPALQRFARYQGTAVGLIRLLRDLGFNWSRGHRLLPRDWLATQSMEADALTPVDLCGPTGSALQRQLQALVGEQVRQALAYLPDDGREQARWLWLELALHQRLLARLTRGNVWQERLELGLWQKKWLSTWLWHRASRRTRLE